ncbi:MAG: hypothetical protein COB67_01435 [SAR324 cluster bacterium]|uniref:Nucleoside phosphorylase domain-containing protein n=1 Tax=SAR324 cluster bacterium TaxID=2024889 RepID=A0A2A4TAJ6_9DELT|nr:MAG: hypothetical protein COB67_01435 [SAR324 cluster bacterium]
MICIVSAIPSEIEELIRLTDSQPTAQPNTWIHQEKGFILAAVGVGYLEAAIRLQQLLTSFPQVRQVLFCGTGGIYQETEGLNIGELYLCQETILCDGAAELGFSKYVPILPHQAIPADLELAIPCKKVRVVTALTLTTDDNLSNVIAQNTGGEVENMELYGIASLCQQLRIPWAGLLAITNRVGSQGHKQWLENHRHLEIKAGKMLAKYVFL